MMMESDILVEVIHEIEKEKKKKSDRPGKILMIIRKMDNK